MRGILIYITLLALVAVMSAPSFALSYVMTDLGPLFGRNSGFTGINDAGQIVGSDWNGAFVYTPGSGVTYLNAASTTGINASGQVAVWQVPAGSYYNHAGVYTPGSGIADLSTAGEIESYACAVNDHGQVVGYSYSAAGYSHTFVYTPGSGLTDPVGGQWSQAYDINNAGQIIGDSDMGSFVYTPQAGTKQLGSLGGNWSHAAAINSSGYVVGKSRSADGSTHAFLYEPGGSMIDLGTLPGNVQSMAYDINDSGLVVGSSGMVDGVNRHAFVYVPGSGMIDLGTLGGTSSSATAINNSGQIVGWSYSIDGAWHAVLWTPVPEPSSLLALLAGLGGFGGMTLRRRR